MILKDCIEALKRQRRMTPEEDAQEAISEALEILGALYADGWVQLAKEEKGVFYNTKARMGVIMREKV